MQTCKGPMKFQKHICYKQKKDKFLYVVASISEGIVKIQTH